MLQCAYFQFNLNYTNIQFMKYWHLVPLYYIYSNVLATIGKGELKIVAEWFSQSKLWLWVWTSHKTGAFYSYVSWTFQHLFCTSNIIVDLLSIGSEKQSLFQARTELIIYYLSISKMTWVLMVNLSIISLCLIYSKLFFKTEWLKIDILSIDYL